MRYSNAVFIFYDLSIDTSITLGKTMGLNKLHIIEDFLFNPDKRKILKSLQCKEDSSTYAEINDLFDQLVGEIGRSIKPKAVFLFEKKRADFNAEELKDCDQLVYCLITLGKEISEKISEHFSERRYLEGMLSEAISNNVLFNYSRDLYIRIVDAAKSKRLGLTRRLTPGDGKLDITSQRAILEMFKEKGSLGVTLTEGCMLSPIKSLAYIYGTGNNLSISDTGHDCSICTRPNCSQRETPPVIAEISLTIVGDGKPHVIRAKSSQNIMTSLGEKGVLLDSPCGGQGTCGKCKVKILSGDIFSKKETGKTNMNDSTGSKFFLACSGYPVTDCTIDIGLSRESLHSPATKFYSSIAEPNSGFQVMPLVFEEVDWQGGDSLTHLVDSKLGRKFGYSLRALGKMAAFQGGARKEHTGSTSKSTQLKMIVHESSVVDVYADIPVKLFGLAIDIGTTTVAMSLVDLISGRAIKTQSLLNSQRRFGTDVISRIQHSVGKMREALRSCICTDILQLISTFSSDEKNSICHMTVAGNTTMLHFLLGLPAESLGLYPFQPVTLDLTEYSFAEVFGHTSLDCIVTVLPGASVFVGADIMAGLLHCRFAESDDIAMLIDIGTNGEIAIGNKEKIACLATAAGPAFEGATIACGSGSVAGAISTFSMEAGNATYTTIDGKDPVGICGSGIIDVMAACLRERVVDKTGRFDQKRFGDNTLPIVRNHLNDLIFFNQKDVREVQLAKSAIRSGVEVLLKTYVCNYDDIKTVYLAGAFGTHVNIENAVAIGLLPPQLKHKVKTVGNSSLGGCIHYLLDRTSKEKLHRLLRNSTPINLANDSEFQGLFIKNMTFPCDE
jgi:uncharacterized 2Fe-2S/4Fe-4S cluster protein (DUF4445 family)